MNRLIAISKRVIFASVKLGIFAFLVVLDSAAAVADSIAKFVSKVLSDTVSVIDQIAKHFGKPVSDAATVSDAILKTTGLGKNDTIGASDSGYLLNQDYVDNPFYFADDYVGTKRTF